MGRFAKSSARGNLPFFIFCGCKIVPVPCSMIGPPRVRGHVPPLQKLSLSLLRFFLPENGRNDDFNLKNLKTCTVLVRLIGNFHFVKLRSQM